MCGIAAIFSKQHFSDSPSVNIQNMTTAVKHRGPDGFGYWSSHHIELGHRRLAIVDLSDAGHQPMHYLDRYVITFNGEIYNYLELKNELLEIGYKFNSHTDTEVIMAAYDAWGKDCLQRLNGMWAFVLYDQIEKTVFMARDRFGVKPLYYWHGSLSHLAVASEIKQFSTLPDWVPSLNEQMTADFILWGVHDHTEQTMFQNVYQFLPGTFIEIKLDILLSDIQLAPEYWYQLPNKPFAGDRREAKERFLDLFTRSLKLRLRADVDIGSCLSGGLDSSSIVCVVSTLMEQTQADIRQKTFSACSEDPSKDERKFADIVIQGRKIQPFYVTPLIEDLKKNLHKLTWHQDEPFSSTSVLAQWRVFEKAHEEACKVLLDGQGADEQLAGYPEFINAHLKELFYKANWIQMAKELVLLRRNRSEPFFKLALRFFYSIMPPRFQILGQLIRHRAKHKMKLQLTNKISIQHPFSRLGHGSSTIRTLARSEIQGMHLQALLRYEDRNSMAHSVESRVPFLDYRLVEFIDSLPSEFKRHNGVSKVVLRDAMQDILPGPILDRQDKIGFATAEETWMKKEPEFFKNLLEEARPYLSSILDVDQILRNFNSMTNGSLPFDFVYWRIMSFAIWRQVFKVGISETESSKGS